MKESDGKLFEIYKESVLRFSKDTSHKKAQAAKTIIGWHVRLEYSRTAPDFKAHQLHPLKGRGHDGEKWDEFHFGSKQQALGRIPGLLSNIFSENKRYLIVLYKVVSEVKLKQGIFDDNEFVPTNRHSGDNAVMYKNEYEGTKKNANRSIYTTEPETTVRYMIPYKIFDPLSLDLWKYVINNGLKDDTFTTGNIAVFISIAMENGKVYPPNKVLKLFRFMIKQYPHVLKVLKQFFTTNDLGETSPSHPVYVELAEMVKTDN